MADVVASAVADTVTLPLTVSLAVTRGITDYYFVKAEPGEVGEARRKFWENEMPTIPANTTP